MYKEIESLKRIGTEPHRSYYIPFGEGDEIGYRCGIIDRRTSSRFTSLNGVWQIRAHERVDTVDINEKITDTIPVPSCVQLHGYDRIQYINIRYPFPVLYPHIAKDNPTWHYRHTFSFKKNALEKYYLNFEGVDSAFYLYVNKRLVGYSQISHATSEFDISDYLLDGENTLDVVVLKWCISSYLECQDKFRFSGIFRDVYILSRPEKHITDYRIITTVNGTKGTLKFTNESNIAINLELEGQRATAQAGESVELVLESVEPWWAHAPRLYSLTLSANGERIFERVGFREVTVDGRVFKINGEAVKLKGVNRHDFNCETGATVSVENMYEDITIMKSLYVNAVRTSHYPNCPEFYQLCDEHGIYLMSEADVEMHGTAALTGDPELSKWREYADYVFFSEGILDRDMALVERDKNRPCVIIWSLGNEASFGEAFLAGARYIRERDKTRPVHYEALQREDDYYFTPLVDMVSMMYPSLDTIRERVLDNPEETRPFVLCEYTHAMGNSCGDISDYWKLIYENEQMMGAFVWEWADHAIKTERGFLYGGDFGEKEHDGNFCVDGLLTPDRKLKSNALEMKAVYSGKLRDEVKDDVEIPSVRGNAESVAIEVDEDTGNITSIKADGVEILHTPMHFNLLRYTDNERFLIDRWQNTYRLTETKQHVYSCEKLENGYELCGAIAANCMLPAVSFNARYTVEKNELTVAIEYEIAEYIKTMPRFGIEACLDKKYKSFAYVGYGPTESYADKRVSSSLGFYESTAEENYDKNYIRPQESGSHYSTRYLRVDGLCTVTADAPYSFSLNPYTSRQIFDTAHNFELPENDFVCLCLDLGMRGVGSNSCGPALPSEYEIPKRAKNTFKFAF